MDLPPTLGSSQTAAPPVLEKKRYHDLDALRAVAMLLGIVLHGLMAYGMDDWPMREGSLPEWAMPVWLGSIFAQIGITNFDTINPYEMSFHFIHGFRMPLFFVVSGFFTAMLWKQRGIRELLKHRAKRIVLPMIAFLVPLWPIIIGVFGLMGAMYKNGEWEKNRQEKEAITEIEITPGPLRNFSYKAYEGKWERLPLFDTQDPARQGTAETGVMDLRYAGIRENFGMVFKGDLDIEKAGEYTFKLGSDDGSLLTVNGEKIVDNDGSHAMKYKEGSIELQPGVATVRVDYFQGPGDMKLSLTMIGPDDITLNLTSGPGTGDKGSDEFKKGLAELEKYVGELPGWAKPVAVVVGIVFAGAIIPLFHHLWFLYYLAITIVLFAIFTWLVRRRGWKAWPEWTLRSPGCLIWLLPLTYLTQTFFWQSFGPDTYTGIVPWPPKVAYYLIFFGFGAMLYGRDNVVEKLGRHWYLYFLACVPLLLVGVGFLETRKAAEEKLFSHLLLNGIIVLYTWLMIIGFMGFFRQCFAFSNRWIRYLSDSSYWLYIAHLPLIIFIQAIVTAWPVWPVVKFTFACVATTFILLVMYEDLIRYTIFGTLLNGKRTREDTAPSTRNRWLAAGLAAVLGVFGAHRFYAGRYWSGQLQLACLLGLIVWWIIGSPHIALSITVPLCLMGWAIMDSILILCGVFNDGQGRAIRNWSKPAQELALAS